MLSVLERSRPNCSSILIHGLQTAVGMGLVLDSGGIGSSTCDQSLKSIG